MHTFWYRKYHENYKLKFSVVHFSWFYVIPKPNIFPTLNEFNVLQSWIFYYLNVNSAVYMTLVCNFIFDPRLFRIHFFSLFFPGFSRGFAVLRINSNWNNSTTVWVIKTKMEKLSLRQSVFVKFFINQRTDTNSADSHT